MRLMENNYILRRLRYALDLGDGQVLGLMARAGSVVAPETLLSYYVDEGSPGYVPCPDPVLGAFLDGLISERRGERERPAGSGPPPKLDNNQVLRKLRIALELTDTDLLDMLYSVRFDVSPSELSALFRRKGHPNYRPCGDQFLRNVIKGLTLRLRGDGEADER